MLAIYLKQYNNLYERESTEYKTFLYSKKLVAFPVSPRISKQTITIDGKFLNRTVYF